MKEDQIFQAPDFLVPITAWRFWSMKVTPRTRKVQLWSPVLMAGRRLWAPGKYCEARCISGRDCDNGSLKPHNLQDVPALPPARCGIYGYKTVEEAFLDLQGKLPGGDDSRPLIYVHGGVLGKVKLWGTIQEHRHGYRAQFAYPVSLAMGICDTCQEPFPVDGIRFLTRKNINPSATFSVPVFAFCFRHRRRDLGELPGVLDSLAKLYKITIGEKPLVP